MNSGFIDSNILVYHLLQNHPDHSERSSDLISRLGQGHVRGACSSTAILETIYVLEKGYRVPRYAAYPHLRDIVSIPSIEFDSRDAILEALEFWKDHSPLSFADCFHLALAKQLGMDRIYTFDRKMDRFPGVERVEP